MEARKYKAKKRLETYEKNLQSWYDSARKTLDIQLSTSMPQQVGTIKTILWVNLLFLGLGLQIMKERAFAYGDLVLFVPVGFSVSLLLFAMILHRKKWYGDNDDVDLPYKYYDEKFARAQLLSTLLRDACKAVDENRKIMSSIARYMHISLWSTLMAGVGLAVVVSLHQPTYLQKGDLLMSDEKPKPPSQIPTNTKPTHESNNERGVRYSTNDSPKPQPEPKAEKK